MYIITERSKKINYSIYHNYAELKVMGVFGVRIWSGAGVSVLVCTRGSAFEMDWWWFGVFQ